MSLNKYGDSGLSPRTNVHAERTMLRHAGPVMVLDKFALAKQMPQNKTQTITFRRPVVFTAKTAPLVEGVTPATDAFDYEDVSGTMKQYGQVSTVTDVIEDTHEDPVLNDISTQLGENIGRTMEALNWGVLRGGTNVMYANGAARTDVNTTVTKDLQRKVIRFLKNQKAMKHTKMLAGSTSYETRPIQASFVAIAHTDLEADIMNMPKFTPVAEYGSRQPLCEEEIGACEQVRYILSPDLAAFTDSGSSTLNGMVSTSSSQTDVYPIIFLGKEAWGTVALRGKGAVTPSIIPVNMATKDDPLSQRGYAGWKAWHLALRLNESWMVRAEVCASDL